MESRDRSTAAVVPELSGRCVCPSMETQKRLCRINGSWYAAFFGTAGCLIKDKDRGR